MDPYKLACKKLDKAAYEAMDCVCFGTILVLGRIYGWKRTRLERFMEVSTEVFKECGADDNLSMVQLCDKELDIELRSSENKSYKECPYLCTDYWLEFKKEHFDNRPYEYQRQWMTLMKQKMIPWMFPQITAAILISLHRKEGWGYDRICTFLGYLDDIFFEFNKNPKKLEKAVEAETGLRYVHTPKGELALLKEDINESK